MFRTIERRTVMRWGNRDVNEPRLAMQTPRAHLVETPLRHKFVATVRGAINSERFAPRQWRAEHELWEIVDVSRPSLREAIPQLLFDPHRWFAKYDSSIDPEFAERPHRLSPPSRSAWRGAARQASPTSARSPTPPLDATVPRIQDN